MKVFFFVLGMLPFLLPLNLYPETDFPKNYLAFLWAVLAFCSILVWRTRTLYIPRFLPWLLCGLVLLWLLPVVMGDHYSGYHVLAYGLALVLISLASIVGATVAASDGRAEFSMRLAWFLVVSGGLLAVISLFRYYGLLTLLVPGFSVGGNRMIGPLGQPNLVALFLALSISGIIFLWETRRLSLMITCIFTGSLVVSGVLTGSRYFYLALVAIFVIWVIFNFLFRAGVVPVERKKLVFPVSAVLFSVVVSVWITPSVDGIIYTASKEAGLIDRLSAEEMMQSRLKYSDESRTYEWGKVISNPGLINSYLLGNGIGAYPAFSYRAELLTEGLGNQRMWTHPHNIFLMFFVEAGVLGVIFLLAAVVYSLGVMVSQRKTPSGIFLSSIIVITFGHNLVEFSLWLWPFLLVFFVVAGAIDKSRSWEFSDRIAPSVSAFLIFSVFSVLSAYFINDYKSITHIFQNEQLDNDDEYALFDAGKNSILGKGAMNVRILRLEPNLAGLTHQKMEIEHFARIWPSQLFLARQSVIDAALGEQDLACARIEQTLTVYPDALNIIHRDLLRLSGRYDVINMEVYEECILRGMSVWISYR